MIDESLARKHLIRYLHLRNHSKGTIIVPELYYGPNRARRADLVLINGRLHAYEIKSEIDTLKRLSGQLCDYDAYFDKVTIVCAKNYTSKVVAEAASHVGILEMSTGSDGIIFRQIRSGRIVEVKDKSALLCHLRVDELRILLRNNSIHRLPIYRAELVDAAKKLPLNIIRKYVLESLKRKHKCKLAQHYIKRPTVDAEKVVYQKNCLDLDSHSSEDIHEIDLTILFKNQKPPKDFPTKVLKRKVQNYYSQS